MKLAVLIAALLSSANVSAAESPAAEAALKTAEDGPPACESGHDDALRDGVVTTRPGETICVELQVHGNKVSPVAAVSVANSDSTLVLRAWNEPGKPDTFLSVHNPLNVFLRYEARMLVPGETQVEYTSSCPVMSRRFGIERWPYAINAITLAEFKAIPESNTMECR
jgi:hypothetical protein